LRPLTKLSVENTRQAAIDELAAIGAPSGRTWARRCVEVCDAWLLRNAEIEEATPSPLAKSTPHALGLIRIYPSYVARRANLTESQAEAVLRVLATAGVLVEYVNYRDDATSEHIADVLVGEELPDAALDAVADEFGNPPDFYTESVFKPALPVGSVEAKEAVTQ
jgi:hypothetical protein